MVDAYNALRINSIPESATAYVAGKDGKFRNKDDWVERFSECFWGTKENLKENSNISDESIAKAIIYLFEKYEK